MIDATQYPQGLVGLMGLRGNQQGLLAPVGLNEVVQPTLDLFDFYVSGRLESLVTAGIAAAAGNILFPELIVPPGEFWYARDYLVQCNPGAGAAARIAPQATIIGVAYAVGDYQSVAANEFLRVRMDRTRFLPPGSQMGVGVQSQTLAPTLVGALSFVRIRI